MKNMIKKPTLVAMFAIISTPLFAKSGIIFYDGFEYQPWVSDSPFFDIVPTNKKANIGESIATVTVGFPDTKRCFYKKNTDKISRILLVDIDVAETNRQRFIADGFTKSDCKLAIDSISLSVNFFTRDLRNKTVDIYNSSLQVELVHRSKQQYDLKVRGFIGENTLAKDNNELKAMLSASTKPKQINNFKVGPFEFGTEVIRIPINTTGVDMNNSSGSGSSGSGSSGSGSSGSGSSGSGSSGSGSSGSGSSGSGSSGSGSSGSGSSGSGNFGTNFSSSGSQYNGGAKTFDTKYQSHNKKFTIAVIDLSKISLNWLKTMHQYLIDKNIPVMILDSTKEDAEKLNKQYKGLQSGPAPNSPNTLQVFMNGYGITSYPAVLENGWVWQTR